MGNPTASLPLKGISLVAGESFNPYGKKPHTWGTWVAQSVKHPTLGLGLGQDLTVCEFEPHIGLCADGAEPAWNSVSPSDLPLLVLCFSKKNK